jgi:SPX domain protein involved in polyphosphate accumulation
MKFGHNLPRNQVPEWASAYIDYKSLKKLIKAAAQTTKEGNEADLAGTYHPHGLCIMYYVYTDLLQSSSTRSIAISKMSTHSTARSMQKLQGEYDCYKIVTAEMQVISKVLTAMSETISWGLYLSSVDN